MNHQNSLPVVESLEPRLLLAGEWVDYQLLVTDLAGAPVTAVEVGQTFQLRAYVQDLRPAAQGVFAGFLDVAFAGGLAHAVGGFSYGSDYTNGRTGSAGSDILDEVGAFAGMAALDGGQRLLFAINFQADAAGTLSFVANPADFSPFHDTLVYGADTPVTTDKIIYGSVSVTVGESTPPSAMLADPTDGGQIRDLVINPRGYIDVTFSDLGGAGLNASTITDAEGEFTLAGPAAAGVTVNGAATLVADTTYRYTLTGSFGLGEVSVNYTAASFADNVGNFNLAASESFTVYHLDVVPPTATLADPTNGDDILLADLNARGYIDITFADTDGSGLDPVSVTDVGAELALVGAGAAGVTISGAGTLVSGTTYRYTFAGNFVVGDVTVNFIAGSFADNQGNVNAAASEGFAVTFGDTILPTAGLADPANSATIGDLTINARGYIDVTFMDLGGSALNVGTITDAGAEFTLGGAAAAGVTVNGAATLVGGTTYRYTFTGSFAPGAVTVNFAAGSFADNAGNENLANPQGFTVSHVDIVPPNADLADPINGGSIDDIVINGRHYLDVTFTDTDGSGLDMASVTDAGAEFTLTGPAAAGVTVNGAGTLVSGTTYRYSYAGNFTPGVVTVNFTAGSFADGQGNLNLAESESFTVVAADLQRPTADLADPANGGNIGDAVINGRHYIDVTFSDLGGSGLNPTTISDAGAEFTMGGAAASGVTVNGVATLVGGTTYRYAFTGNFTPGTVAVYFSAGSFADNAANTNLAASQSFTITHVDLVAPTANLAGPTNGSTISAAVINGNGYIDVTFLDTDGSGLNPATVTDTGAEFALGGAGAAGVVVNGAATLVSGATYRYTFTGSFTAGDVTVDFVAGSFADNAGNGNSADSKSFGVSALIPGVHLVITDSSGPAGDLAVALPSTALGSTSGPQTFTLTNVGTQALTIKSLKLSGTGYRDYVMTVRSATGQIVRGSKFTIASGQSYTVEVQLRPYRYGGIRQTAAVIKLATTDPTQKSALLNITGTVADDAPDTVATAVSVGVLGRKATTLTLRQIGNTDRSDVFAFDITGTQIIRSRKVTLKLTGLKGDADLYLIDSDGVTILAASSKGGKSAETIIKNLAPGRYYVRVASPFGVETPYTLTMSAV